MRKGASSDGGPCRTWPDRMDRRRGFAQGSSAPTPSTSTTMSPAAIGNEDAEGTLQRGRARERPINASREPGGCSDHENDDQCENEDIDDQGRNDDDQG
jgi:hypothetical protein